MTFSISCICGESDLKFAVCECGAKIEVVQDLREMTRRIDAHAAIHEKNEPDPEKAEARRCRIERQLVRQVIMALKDMNTAPPRL